MASWRRNLTSWFQTHRVAVPAPSRTLRTSLGLEQFVPLLAEVEHPAVLDLGCIWQSTVDFFTRAGCKLYAEDLFQHLQTLAEQSAPEGPPLRERFLPTVLRYPDQHFRGILAWDLFDFLPDELVEPLAERLHKLLEPGGALLLLFHLRRDEVPFTRYRVVDGHTLELLPGSLPLSPARAFSHRALLELFAPFRSSRTFLGRDNLRELFLLK